MTSASGAARRSWAAAGSRVKPWNWTGRWRRCAEVHKLSFYLQEDWILNNSEGYTQMCVFSHLAEMELMSSSDCRLSSVREQKRRLQLELQGLDAVQTGEYRSFICCHVNVVKCKPTTSCLWTSLSHLSCTLLFYWCREPHANCFLAFFSNLFALTDKQQQRNLFIWTRVGTCSQQTLIICRTWESTLSWMCHHTSWFIRMTTTATYLNIVNAKRMS